MKISSKQLRLGLFVLLGLSVVLFVAVTVLGLSKLSKKSQQVIDLKIQSKTLDNELLSLASAKKQVATYSYFNDVAKTVIPNDKDQAQAVVDILNLADSSGIQIQSVTFPSSSLGVTSLTTSGTSSSSSATKSVVSQAKPVTGISGLYALPLSVTPQSGDQIPASRKSTYPKLLSFLSKIESNRRTAQIDQVNIQPLENSSGPTGELNFSLTINIFIRPGK
jgi:hypothetical protein